LDDRCTALASRSAEGDAAEGVKRVEDKIIPSGRKRGAGDDL